MKVIFLQNVKGTARTGDVKDVASGYARNYLLPRKIAQLADTQGLRRVDALMKKREIDREQRDTWAKEIAQRVEDMTLQINGGKVNAQGHLYGSVSTRDIARIANEQGITIEPEDIELDEHIKSVGQFDITLDLVTGIKPTLKIDVVAEK